MNDFARFDGWVMDDGNIWFSDFNPLSGMEQNSFLFQQATRVGLTHRSVIYHILSSACRRNNIQIPEFQVNNLNIRKNIAVLFGGATSERQVSLMSGTNIWLKLKSSKKYKPVPYFADTKDRLWKIPYSLLLNHTVEEITDSCERAEMDEERLKKFEKASKLRLGINGKELFEEYFLPKIYSLDQVIAENQFVFMGFHGGKWENGTNQKLLEEKKVKFNGSGSEASRICMDKYITSETLKGLEKDGIFVATKKIISTEELVILNRDEIIKLWDEITKSLSAKSLIIKPVDDGCSSGIVRLSSYKDLSAYINFLKNNAQRIPENSFVGQSAPIEMSPEIPKFFLFENFIETDKILATGNKLKITDLSGWIEVTVGVLENKGKIHSLSPTLTVAETSVLSVEEKFQGGTGINITPPPETILSKKNLVGVKKRIEAVAKRLKISGYARIDAFVERKSGNIIVIEANTLPALTPSTVLFHQALAENPSIMPMQLLEKIIESGQIRHTN